jgi:para-aminobenzoate synthetase component 2
MTRILVVDNRDSFVHNLVDYLRQLDAHVDVVDGTHRLAGDLHRAITQQPLQYHAVLLSPGPGTPEEAIVSRDLLATVNLPVLGVCLGHQVLAVATGGSVGPAPELVHGGVSEVYHDGRGLFRDIPNPMRAGRYHSLTVEPASVPTELEVTAWATDGVIMGLRHRHRPLESVQFHPESILTPDGLTMLRNWLDTIPATAISGS